MSIILKMMRARDHSQRWTILVVSEDEAVQKLVSQALCESEICIIVASSVREFFEKLMEGEIDLIIYDADLLPIKAIEAFSIAKAYHPDIPSILLYEDENYEVTKSIIKKRVIYRMLKPVNKNDLKQIYTFLRKNKQNEIPD